MKLWLVPLAFFLWKHLRPRFQEKHSQSTVPTEIPLPVPIPKKVITFSNSHWNIAYHFGVAKFIQSYLDLNYLELKGISFGSLPVLCLHHELEIDNLFQSWKQTLYHSNPCIFLWKYWRNYSKWCHMWFQNKVSKYPTSILVYKYPDCFEIDTLNAKDILSLSYSLPFPSIVPRKLQDVGYIRECYWYPSDELTITLTDSKTFPTPIPLQIRSWYQATEQDLDQLFEMGYLSAYLFFHQDTKWIPYFKQPPKVQDLWSLRDVSRRLQSYLEGYI